VASVIEKETKIKTDINYTEFG